ncbi:MAG: hypothetical protein M1826_007242 [Phylliscum demangeonii]|nr:MAG: hypothetical protein M1826_007242 [Phylliscum demangeonii]
MLSFRPRTITLLLFASTMSLGGLALALAPRSTPTPTPAPAPPPATDPTRETLQHGVQRAEDFLMHAYLSGGDFLRQAYHSGRAFLMPAYASGRHFLAQAYQRAAAQLQHSTDTSFLANPFISQEDKNAWVVNVGSPAIRQDMRDRFLATRAPNYHGPADVLVCFANMAIPLEGPLKARDNPDLLRQYLRLCQFEHRHSLSAGEGSRPRPGLLRGYKSSRQQQAR